MAAIVEKICEPNGTVVYRVIIKLAKGSTKIENFARLFDSQKRIQELEGDNKKRSMGTHYG